MTDRPPQGEIAGDVAPTDNLESVIAQAEGALDRTYRVTRGDEALGYVGMADVMQALVRRPSGYTAS